MAKVLQSFTLYCCPIIRGQRLSKTVFSVGVGHLKSHRKCCESFGTYSQILQRRKRVQDQSKISSKKHISDTVFQEFEGTLLAEFMESETKKYEMGKRWLAKMMGADIETFTDSDVEESLKYLLPTKLFAKDARPLLKHPVELFPENKNSFSSDGRPVHPAFYTGAKAFHDLLCDIFKHGKIADQTQEKAFSSSMKDEAGGEKNPGPVKVRWLHKNELETFLEEELSLKNYEVILYRLKKLAGQTSQNNFEQIKPFLEKFQTPIIQTASQFNIEKLDGSGKAHAKGYRKRAMAEVWISNGTGKIIINDSPLIEYFDKQEDRNQVWHPFIELDCMNKFDVECNVLGGGTTGQSGATRLAISRALTSISSGFLKPLMKAGLLTRDTRFVERKKPGQKKARKKFAWVKR